MAMAMGRDTFVLQKIDHEHYSTIFRREKGSMVQRMV